MYASPDVRACPFWPITCLSPRSRPCSITRAFISICHRLCPLGPNRLGLLFAHWPRGVHMLLFGNLHEAGVLPKALQHRMSIRRSAAMFWPNTANKTSISHDTHPCVPALHRGLCEWVHCYGDGASREDCQNTHSNDAAVGAAAGSASLGCMAYRSAAFILLSILRGCVWVAKPSHIRTLSSGPWARASSSLSLIIISRAECSPPAIRDTGRLSRCCVAAALFTSASYTSILQVLQ